MNKKLIIAVDVDDTVANLIDAWLEIYNDEHGDNLREHEITDWDISKFAKHGKNIYDYLKNPSLYDNVFPIKDSLNGINSIRKMGHRVIYVTASTIEQSGRKYQWLRDFGFVDSEYDYIEAKDKSLICADILIDDGMHNIQSFRKVGILMNKSWNKKYDYKPRCNNWKEVVEYIKKEENL